MKERRPLIAGLQPEEAKKLEAEFVFGAKRKPELTVAEKAEPIAKPAVEKVVEQIAQPIDRKVLPQISGRVPVTTRCTPEVASALKRASLQRQLAGTKPFHVQDIMEAALEQWLRINGYYD